MIKLKGNFTGSSGEGGNPNVNPPPSPVENPASFFHGDHTLPNGDLNTLTTLHPIQHHWVFFRVLFHGLPMSPSKSTILSLTTPYLLIPLEGRLASLHDEPPDVAELLIVL